MTLRSGRLSAEQKEETLDLSMVADGEVTPQMEAMAALTASKVRR